MVDLDLAKAHVRAEGTAEDALIQSYIDAAGAWLEGYTGRLLTRRAVTQPVRAFGEWIDLWWGPDPAFTGDGAGIDYVDSDAAAATVVAPRLVGARVYAPVDGWPARSAATPIAATYVAGYDETATRPDPAAAPADLEQAQLMLVAHWYMNREAVAVGAPASEVPLAVEAIARRYRPVLL